MPAIAAEAARALSRTLLVLLTPFHDVLENRRRQPLGEDRWWKSWADA